MTKELWRTTFASRSRTVALYFCSSDGKASAYNAGDLGSIPGLGISSGEGNRTHSSILAWEIPWTEEPGRLQSMGSQRVGHDWATSISFFLSFFPVLNQGPDRENQRCCSPPGWPLSNFPPTPSAIRTLGIVAFPFFFAKLTSPTVHLQVSARTQATVADSPATACCEVFEWYLSGLCLLLLICPTYSIRTLCLMLT